MNPTKYLILACLFTAGCGNGWDGTWLFRFDENSASRSGDCVDPDAPETDYLAFGTTDLWVDIVFTAEGTCVVNFGDIVLTGAEEGGNIVVTNVDGYSVEGELNRTTTTVSMVRAGGTMTGSFTSLDEQVESDYGGGTTSFTCTDTGDFSGERIVSSSKEFVAPSSSGF